jgi:hypothetical protein
MALGLAASGGVGLLADIDAARASAAGLDPAQRAQWLAEAVRLAPHHSGYRRDYAAALWDGGNADGALQQLGVALRDAPADGTLWMQYEFQLLRHAPDDPALRYAISRVDDLGPHQPELQLAQADLAAQSWHWVSPAVRQAWLPSLRFVLAQDRDDFLVRSFRRGEEGNLCSAAGELGLAQWCRYAMAARMVCARGELNPEQVRLCGQWGALPASGGGAVP